MQTVEQRHRDAAADLIRSYWLGDGHPQMRQLADSIQNGGCKCDVFSQAFARFEASLPPSAPVDREVLARAMYDSRPHTVISSTLAEQTGLPKGKTLTWDVAVANGADMSALYRYADAIIAALALPPSGIAEMVREMCAKEASDHQSDDDNVGDINNACRTIASAIRSLDLSNKGVG